MSKQASKAFSPASETVSRNRPTMRYRPIRCPQEKRRELDRRQGRGSSTCKRWTGCALSKGRIRKKAAVSKEAVNPVNPENHLVVFQEKSSCGVTPGTHSRFKGLGKIKTGNNLRDHMTDLEFILTMLGEASTTEIARRKDAVGFDENRTAAQEGGTIAGDARKALEVKSGKSVVSGSNYLALSGAEAGAVDGLEGESGENTMNLPPKSTSIPETRANRRSTVGVPVEPRNRPLFRQASRRSFIHAPFSHGVIFHATAASARFAQ